MSSRSYWFSGQEAPCESGLNPNCPLPPESTTLTDGAVRLVGSLRTSTGAPYTGWIRMTAQDTIATYGRSPRAVISQRPDKIAVMNGVLDAFVYPSQGAGSVYLFEIGYTRSVPGSEPGDPPIESDIVTDSFLARVPLATTEGQILDFNSLVPTGITHDRYDTSARRVAQEILSDQALRDLVRPQLRICGPYQVGSVYQYGDLVTVPGSPIQTWVYQAQSPSTLSGAPSGPLWLQLL